VIDLIHPTLLTSDPQGLVLCYYKYGFTPELTTCPKSGRIVSDRPVCLFALPFCPMKDIPNESKRKNYPRVLETVFLERLFEHLD
jgi:hypothetical protein